MARIRAYTLLELLVALTIVVVLAGLFVPILTQAKDFAKQSVCIQNNRQLNLASTIYLTDYDDRFFLSKYTGASNANFTNDRTWVQLVGPYLRSFQVMRCPGDWTRAPGIDPVFDSDLATGFDAERYYNASLHTNSGFNFVYLSPIVQESNGEWSAKPRSSTESDDPGKTIFFGDSVWEVLANGRPNGGGSYVVIPPCRWNANDGSDSFGLSTYNNNQVFTAARAWDDLSRPVRSNLGGLWPWHRNKLTVVMLDASVKTLSITEVVNGCKVQSNWGGRILNPSQYLWDLR